MSLLNQLRITDPEDRLKIYDLDEAGSITSLGQDDANDILLEGPGVAPFQLELDYRQPPYRLTVPDQAEPVTVNDEEILPGSSCEIHDRDEIRVAGYIITFRVKEEQPSAPDEAPAPPPPPEPGPPPPDETPPSPPPPEPGPPTPPDETPAPLPPPEPGPSAPEEPPAPDTEPAEPAILTSLSQEAWAVEVEQTVTLQLTVVNAGDLVAGFNVAAEGVPQEWVTISPAEFHLNDGEQATVDVTFTPPRSPASRAGDHRLMLVTTSSIYPGARSQASATITIHPYYELSVGNLSPRHLSIPGSQPAGQVEVPLTNKGNSDVVAVLAGEDDAHACRFEFEIPDELEKALYLTKEADLWVPVDQTVRVPVKLVPQSRPLIGPGGRLFDLRPRVYPYTITVTVPQAGQRPWTLAGEWENVPRFSRRVLLVSALALILLLLVSFLPGITDYHLSATPDSIRAGQLVELNWTERPLISFKLNGQSVEPPVTLRPEQTTTYQLMAETWLSRLLPFLEGKPDEIRIGVMPVKPDILLFEALPDRVIPGERVVLSWVVDDAEKVVLIDHSAGLQETLDSPCGSREVQIGQNPGRYTLRAIAADGSVAEQAATVEVGSPVIRVFSVKPAAITTSTPVALAWQVLSASGTPTITLRESFLVSGTVVATPSILTAGEVRRTETVADTTEFSLIADSGTEIAVATARVKVAKPTWTPTPTHTPTPTPAHTPTPTPTATPGTIIVYTALGDRELVALGATKTISLTKILDKSAKTDLTLSEEELRRIPTPTAVALTRILDSLRETKLTYEELRKFDYVLMPENTLRTNVLIVRESTEVLVRTLLAEKENPQADVIWGVAATGMIRLRAEGLLEPLAGPYQPQGLEGIPPGWRDPTWPPQWLGLSAWPAVFCVNRDRLKEKGIVEAPDSWEDLTNPDYDGLIAMPSPYTSGTGYMVVSGLLQMDPFGEPEGWAKLDRLHENIAWYTASGSEPCDQAADDRSQIAIGLSGASRPDEKLREKTCPYVFPEEGYGWEMDAVALVRKDEINKGAQAFVEWAISQEAMQKYAQFRPIVSYPGVESKEVCFSEFEKDKMISNRLLWASANYERIVEKWVSRYAGEPDLIQLEPAQ